MEEGRAGSIGELVSEARRLCKILKACAEDPQEVWFRGEKAARYPLLPGLYRDDTQRFHFDESSLMDRFRCLATPLVRNQLSDWEWYFLARHHGLPSRLIDWSENLLAAAHFATKPHAPKTKLEQETALSQAPAEPMFDGDSPVIWLLDAGSLNHASMDTDRVLVLGGSRTNKYLPDALANEQSAENAAPIALMPPRANTRIVAQQGMFTLHGHETMPLDEYARKNDMVQMAQILLDRSRVPWIWEELHTCGVHSFSLFPDLDNAATYVHWIYQSEK